MYDTLYGDKIKRCAQNRFLKNRYTINDKTARQSKSKLANTDDILLDL